VVRGAVGGCDHSLLKRLRATRDEHKAGSGHPANEVADHRTAAWLDDDARSGLLRACRTDAQASVGAVRAHACVADPPGCRALLDMWRRSLSASSARAWPRSRWHGGRAYCARAGARLLVRHRYGAIRQIARRPAQFRHGQGRAGAPALTPALRDERRRRERQRRREALTGTIGRAPGVDGLDDLVVDALEVDRGDAEVAVARSALDDDERHTLVGHLDGVGLAESVGGSVGGRQRSRRRGAGRRVRRRVAMTARASGRS
jgi:hypothetical protein